MSAWVSQSNEQVISRSLCRHACLHGYRYANQGWVSHWRPRAEVQKPSGGSKADTRAEVSPDLLVRVLVVLVANYWSWPGGGGGVQPHNPRTS